MWTVDNVELWPLSVNGTLKLGPLVRKVILDVGVHEETQFFRHADESHDLVVIGFEPIPQLYAIHKKHPRICIVPAAVSVVPPDNPGRISFNVFNGVDSPMSSLLQLKRSGSLPQKSVMSYYVSIITLEEVLKLLPKHVRIPLVKVDAQGSDLLVVKSASAHISRIERIQVECQDLPVNHERMVYVGQPTKQDFVEFFANKGFVLERCWDNQPVFREENCIFARSDIALRLDAGCFKPLRVWASRQVDSNQGIEVRTLVGPYWIRRKNLAKLAERFCCDGPYGPETQDYCFSAGRTYEHCCLRSYFEAIDYIRLWHNFYMEEVENHNFTQVHFIWHT